MHPLEVIRRPLITEKGTALAEKRKYLFEVQQEANKQQVKEAVEKAFGVKVTSVNMISMPGKTKNFGRTRVAPKAWKKAVVTLAEGQKIQLIEGI